MIYTELMEIIFLVILAILLFGSLAHETHRAVSHYHSDKEGETIKGGTNGSNLREDEVEAR